MIISHIKLPPRHVPPNFYKRLYVVLKENRRGFVLLKWYRWPKFVPLAHPLFVRLASAKMILFVIVGLACAFIAMTT